MDEHRRFGRGREENEERYGRSEEGFESGGAGRYAQSSDLRGRESRGPGAAGQGRYGQGSYGQGSYGRGSYEQSGYGQGGRYEPGDEDRSFDRSFGDEAWRPGEPSGSRGSSFPRHEEGRTQNPSRGDRAGQLEWSESGGFRGEPGMRRFQGSSPREQGSYGAFQGGEGSRSFGRSGLERGEGADFDQQRYSGSYGLGYGGQRGESSGSMTGRFFGKGPKGYTRSDERIKEQLSDKLEQNGDIDASEITVEVKQGEVTLEGTVSDRWMKRLAEDVAEDSPGVKQVHNRIRVEKGNGSSTSSPKDRESSYGSSSGSTPGSEKGSRNRSNV